eukprot:121202-Chlamydomonas_euryale.AAC.1
MAWPYGLARAMQVGGGGMCAPGPMPCGLARAMQILRLACSCGPPSALVSGNALACSHTCFNTPPPTPPHLPLPQPEHQCACVLHAHHHAGRVGGAGLPHVTIHTSTARHPAHRTPMRCSSTRRVCSAPVPLHIPHTSTPLMPPHPGHQRTRVPRAHRHAGR